jgi:hypothetical protein
MHWSFLWSASHQLSFLMSLTEQSQIVCQILQLFPVGLAAATLP